MTSVYVENLYINEEVSANSVAQHSLQLGLVCKVPEWSESKVQILSLDVWREGHLLLWKYGNTLPDISETITWRKVFSLCGSSSSRQLVKNSIQYYQAKSKCDDGEMGWLDWWCPSKKDIEWNHQESAGQIHSTVNGESAVKSLYRRIQVLWSWAFCLNCMEQLSQDVCWLRLEMNTLILQSWMQSDECELSQ